MRLNAFCLSFAGAFALAANAATGDSPPVDLRALLEELDRTSPELLEARTRIEAAELLPEQRSALPDPKLSVSYTNDTVDDLTLGDSEFSNLSVGWEQEVPSRRVRRSAGAVAEAQAETFRASTAAASARERARVISLYAELWRVDRTRELLEESRQVLATAAASAEARYDAGDGPQESLIRAQNALRRVGLEASELTLERRRAEISLAAALGRAGTPEFGAVAELPDAPGPLDANEAAKAAASASPAVLESRALEHEAAYELEDASAQRQAQFSWMAAYQYRGGLDPMVAGGFAVRLPVWKNRKQARAIATAEISRTAAALGESRAEISAASEARALVVEVDSIDERLRLYQEALVPQAAAALESANAAFGAGRADMSLVLTALAQWIADRRGILALTAQRTANLAALEAVTARRLLTIPDSGGCHE